MAKVSQLATSFFRSKLKNNFYHTISDVYRPEIIRKKERLIELIKEKAEIAKKSAFAREMKRLKGFYTLEMAPPKLNEMQKLLSDLAVVKEFITTGSYKYLTVKQLWLVFLVALEVYLWFYLGETVGKFHIVGYKVHPPQPPPPEKTC